MDTQLILFRQQLLLNPKFAKIVDYGWSYTGSWTKSDGLITSSGAGTLYQEQLLIIGANYRLKYTISGSPSTDVVDFSDGVAFHQSAGADGSYIVDFIASGQDIIFTAGATFNASISNVSLVATPESFNIDLQDDIPIPLNFNIDNIFQVNQRKTPFSKTIKIKGTHNNNLAFNHIYKVNSQSLFNPNVKSPVLIKNKGITMFNGALCLDDVIKKLSNGEQVEYNTSVTGQIRAIFDKLGTKTIRDLDFSDYDHIYDIDSIKGSWNDSIFINAVPSSNRINTYTSPLVIAETPVLFGGLNRIELQFASPHSFSVGDEVYVGRNPIHISQIYSYDQVVIDVPANDKIILDAYRVTTPISGLSATGATVAKEMLAGFGYWYPCVNNGTWMRNHFAQGFITGTGLLIVGETYIKNTYNTGDDFMNVGASVNADGEIFVCTGTSQTSGQLIIGQSYVISTFVSGDDFTNLGVDNINGAEFTALQIDQDSGDLIVGQDYEIIVHHPSDDFTSVGASSNNTGIQFTASGSTPAIWTHKSILRPINFLLPTSWSNSSVLTATTMFPTTWTPPSILTTYRDTSIEGSLRDKGSDFNQATDNYWECYDFVPHIFLREVLLKIFNLLEVEYDCTFFDSKIFRRLIIPCEQTYCNTGLVEGGSVVMNSITPNIKLTDIFTTVVNMFNLAVIPNDDDPNTLKFVNRSEFFSNTPVNWTGKLDASQDFILQMMNRNFPKSYTFKYKDSEDLYNTDYNTDFGNLQNGSSLPNTVNRKYGDAFIDLRSDYLTATNQVQLIFEPSVMSDDTERTAMFYSTTYSSGPARAVSNRILIAGMRSLSSALFNLVSKADSSKNELLLDYYPYAGHLDNHFSPHPRWDINFSKPLGVYFTGSTNILPTVITDDDWDENGLYNLFWSKYIGSIANPDSKIVTGYFKLSMMDIYKLDFQTPIIVQDYKLRLNKIIDWDLNGTGICKCEFLYSGE